MPAAQAPSPRGAIEYQPAERRTIVIRGQVAPPRRRPPRRPAERIAGTRPDRAALWAVLIGVFLIVVAITTGA
jgi:hypothetical protein